MPVFWNYSPYFDDKLPRIFQLWQFQLISIPKEPPPKCTKENRYTIFLKICVSGNSKGYHLVRIISAWNYAVSEKPIQLIWATPAAVEAKTFHGYCTNRLRLTEAETGHGPYNDQHPEKAAHQLKYTYLINVMLERKDKHGHDIILKDHFWALGKVSRELARKAVGTLSKWSKEEGKMKLE